MSDSCLILSNDGRNVVQLKGYDIFLFYSALRGFISSIYSFFPARAWENPSEQATATVFPVRMWA
jgi:hypothetical protein